MAGLAHVFDRIHPLRLGLHRLWNLVALVARSRKFRGRGNVEHRVPVHAGIELCRRSRRYGRLDSEADKLAGTRIKRRAIGQTIAAHPYFVVGVRQFGNDEAALIVAHHHFGIFGRKVFRFGDNPYTASAPLGPTTWPPMSCAPISRPAPKTTLELSKTDAPSHPAMIRLTSSPPLRSGWTVKTTSPGILIWLTNTGRFS